MMTKGQQRPRWSRPTPRHARYVNRSARPHSLSRSCLVCGGFMLPGPQLPTARELGDTLLRLAQQCRRPRACCRRPPCPGVDVVLPWRIAGCPPAPGAGYSTLHPRQHRALAFRMGHDPGVDCRALPPGPSGCWGTRSKPWPASTRPWRWRTSCRIPLVWRLRGVGGRDLAVRREVPAVHEQAEAAVALATEQGFPLWAARERACVGGRWPCRARVRRGWTRSARASPPGGPPGQRCRPYYCTLLADVCDHLGHPEDGLQALAEAHTLVEQQENAGGKRKSVASGRLAPAADGDAAGGGGSLVPPGSGCRPPPGGEIARAARCHEPHRLWQQQGKRDEARALLAPI